MRTYLIGALVVMLGLSFVPDASALVIRGNFTGEVENARGNLNPDTMMFEGYGLGIEIGDRIVGSLSYDAATGAPIALQARVGGISFVAQNLQLIVRDEGSINYFVVRGEVGNGLYMGVGFFDGFLRYSTPFPTSLESDVFQFASFTLRDEPVFPVQLGSSPIESIAGAITVRTRTVPEPGTGGLLAVVLLLGVAAGLRLRHTRDHASQPVAV